MNLTLPIETSDIGTLLWNGAHNGNDSDLLRERDRITEKHCPVQANQKPSTRPKVVRALIDAAPLTMVQLAQATDLTVEAVNSHLDALKKEGRIRSRDIEERTPAGRTQRAYWLVEVGAAKATL